MRYKIFKNAISSAILALSVSTIVYIISVSYKYILEYSDLFKIVIGILVGAIISMYLALIFRTINKNPTPITISLLGQPGIGKTVYLTILFDSLDRIQSPNIVFQPYGTETIEEVNSSLALLRQGIWLPSTKPETIFFFRANVKFGNNIFQRRFTIEFGDYAGEKIEEFDSTSEYWLHRSDYFRYAIRSDILFLAVDGEILCSYDHDSIAEMELSLVAAIQVLLNERDVPANKKMLEPVAILLMKADRMDKEFTLKKAEARLERLISVCKNRCKHFEMFLVSSVGHVELNGGPPRSIEPKGVIEPLVWSLPRASA
jgi:hypothetical protein